MWDKRQDSENRRYIEREGLDKIIDFAENADYVPGVFDTVSGQLSIPFPPKTEDLVRLHRLIRQRKCFTVLEFGIGYSTLVMAEALRRNEQDWSGLRSKPALRNRFMFQIFSVDASLTWIKNVQKRIPAVLRDRIHLCHSGVRIGTFQGQLCSYYEKLPDIVPDFIYLDGPSPKDVKGHIQGLSFQCAERTVMSGDLLLMESTFLPGTFILVDGRTNNARFLQRNWTRKYSMQWDKKGDITTFELREPRLGRHNLLGTDFF